MRIRDWSSDVCSSDLKYREGQLQAGHIIAGLVIETESFRLRAQIEECVQCRYCILLIHFQGRFADAYPCGQCLKFFACSGGSSEERRVGTVCVSTCRSWGSPYH